MDQVAVIDFVGGQPPATELSQLGNRHMLVTRDGATHQGRFVNMVGGETLLWENEAGQRQQYRDSRRQPRLPQPAERAYRVQLHRAARGGAAAAPATAQAFTVRVDSQQQWTDTGLTVNQGDHVTFNASGQVQVRPGQAATPDGSAERALDPGRTVAHRATRLPGRRSARSSARSAIARRSGLECRRSRCRCRPRAA